MKIQIDTQAKIIKVLEPVKLSDLTELLKKMLGDQYDEYTIWFTSEYIPWINPILVPYNPPYPYNPWITWITSHASNYIGDGIYNIDLQEFNLNN